MRLLLPLVMEDQVFSPAYACVQQTKTEKASRRIGCTLNDTSYKLAICTTRQQESCRLIGLLKCSCLRSKNKQLLLLVIEDQVISHSSGLYTCPTKKYWKFFRLKGCALNDKLKIWKSRQQENCRLMRLPTAAPTA